MRRLPGQMAIACIRAFGMVRKAVFPRAVCRFVPSCSVYAMEAFRKYPFWKALWLSVKRILRCHPFCKGGYDPLPEPGSRKE